MTDESWPSSSVSKFLQQLQISSNLLEKMNVLFSVKSLLYFSKGLNRLLIKGLLIF